MINFKFSKKIKRIISIALCTTMIVGGPGTTGLVQAADSPVIYDNGVDNASLQQGMIRSTSDMVQKEGLLSDGKKEQVEKDIRNQSTSNDQGIESETSNKDVSSENKEEDERTKIEDKDQVVDQDDQEEDSTKEDQEELDEGEKELKPVLYWNPSSMNSSNRSLNAVSLGNDEGDGQSITDPLLTLDATLQKAKELQESLGETITVYVMSPMEINSLEQVQYDGEGIRLMPWEGRGEKDKLLFKIVEGTLELSNMELLDNNDEKKEDILISVENGTVGFGEKFLMDGKISVDYKNNPDQEPIIQVHQVPQENEVFGIQLQGIEDTLEVDGKKIVEATYEDGDKGEDLKHHFYIANEDIDALELEVSEENDAVLILKKLARASSDPIYWNVNPISIGTEGDSNYIAGGDDDNNSGLVPTAPVLTWDKVLEIGKDYPQRRVIAMSPVQVGSDRLPKDADGNYILDGEGITTIEQYQNRNISTFIIEPDQTLTLKNISVVSGSAVIRIVDPTEVGEGLGKLKIDQGTYIGPGYIQTELDTYNAEELKDCTVELLTSDTGKNTYELYYSDIIDSMIFNLEDVVKVPEGEKASDYANTIFKLNKLNIEDGWSLRPDTGSDDGTIAPVENQIELYKKFIYKGVYLNGQSGNDSWYGGNSNWPVKTFEQAKKILFENWDEIAPEYRVIYICDVVDVDTEITWDLEHTDGSGIVETATVKGCSGEEDHTRFHTGPVSSTLVRVKAGGKLTTTKINFEYGKMASTSSIINVVSGGSYVSAEGTSLIGNPEAINTTGYNGAGIVVEGVAGQTTTVTMEDGTITKFGSGIIVNGGGTDTTVNVNGGTITNNSQITMGRPGGGIYLSSATLNMTGGLVNKNLGSGSVNKYEGYGGGVYVIGDDAIFTMSGGEISENSATGNAIRGDLKQNSKGSGVCIESGNFHLIGTALITHNNENSTAPLLGIGVFVGEKATMEMSQDATISFHLGKYYGWSLGGGIYNKGKLTVSGGKISDNKADYGGGIYHNNGILTLEGGTIQENQVNRSGGGIYTTADANLLSGKVIGNSASDGGGVYIYPTGSSSSIIGKDNIMGEEETLVLEDNTASSSGGGVCLFGKYADIRYAIVRRNTAGNMGGGIYNMGSSTLHIKNADIYENEALEGGGIANGGTLVIENGRFLENNASEKGSTIEVYSGSTYLLGGTYKGQENTADSYGMFFDIEPTRSGRIYLNPTKMDIQDKVYLNTTNSNFGILEALNNNENKIQLYLNPKEFTTGSLVAYPANLASVNYSIGLTSYSIPLNRLASVESWAKYFYPGLLPPKTHIGGYEKNLILIGQGVYINGVAKSTSYPNGGDDRNTGTSPSDAVYTFERAKELLGTYITNAENDPSSDGFEPYIYVCDTITIKGNTTWDLDPKNYVQSKVTTLPQMKRFALLSRKMIDVTSGSTLNIETMILDGNISGVKQYSDPILAIQAGGAATINHGTIQNNRGDGISVAGNLQIKGTKESPSMIKNIAKYGILLMNEGIVKMSGYSEIFAPYYLDGEIENGLVPGVGAGGGINMAASNTKTTQAGLLQVELTDFATIRLGNTGNNSRYGINSSISGTPTVWASTMSPRIKMSGSSKIINSYYGVKISGDNNVFRMEGQASIIDCGTGIDVTSSSKDSQVIMSGNSSIRKEDGETKPKTGINMVSGTVANPVGTPPHLTVTLEEDACIENQGFYAINLYSGISQEINLKDRAIIQNNGTGISANLSIVGVNEENRVKVKMSGTSTIKNSEKKEGFATSSYSGIYYYSGEIDYILSENATITDNNGSGVEFSNPRNENNSNATLTLLDNATISNNGKNGIIANEGTNKNKPKIILKNNSLVANNQLEGIKTTYDTEIELRDTSSITGNGIDTTIKRGQGIYTNGLIRLDSTAKVEQEIFLNNPEKFITLSVVPGTFEEFILGVSKKFAGQIVVAPDKATIYDATSYLPHFHKTTQEGNFPEGREIVARSPNLVIDNENNVYLAGPGASTQDLEPGNDRNNGLSPGSPVATFDRAVEILKTLDKDANIVICNYTIKFGLEATTTTWSFGADGGFTNNKGDHWTPKVIRDSTFAGDLITIGPTNTQTVFTLKNITIDGNKENFNPVTTSTAATRLIWNQGGTVNLNQGSILQNNKLMSKGTYNGTGGAISNSGVLNINGGIIQGNTIGDFYNKDKKGAGIYNEASGVVNMTSGEIRNNYLEGKSPAYGAAITNVGSGTVNLKGGKISGNSILTVNAKGSAIYQEGVNTKLNLSGGVEITDNMIDNSQGISLLSKGTIYIQSGSMDSSNAIISNNKIISNPGSNIPDKFSKGSGIYSEDGIIKLSSTILENNQAVTAKELPNTWSKTQGGGIYVTLTSTLLISSGKIINNQAGEGAAIYSDGTSKVVISGGVIKDNGTPDGTPAVKNQSGIYVGTPNFNLKGGGSIISDRIYLSSVKYPIILGGTIYQKNRIYDVEVGPTFKKGDVVVKPDGTDTVGGVIDDASPYLRNFAIKDSLYVLERSEINGKTLVLKRLVFIDSINGDDKNSGGNPEQALKTMKAAQASGGADGNYIIYASGPIIVSDTETWSLPSSAWVSRYTGFGVISASGGTSIKYDAYKKEIVRVPINTTLNLQDIAIYGRRSIDTVVEGESLLLIEEGGTATTTAGTLLSRNTTPVGGYGGAVYNKGTLHINGVTINVVTASRGNAIYQNGVLNLDGQPMIDGQVFLAGQGKSDSTSHSISVTNEYIPGAKDGFTPTLDVGIENPFSGRKVIEYPVGIIPTNTQQGYYILAPEVTAMYSLLQRKDEQNVLELYKKGQVYINGISGSDGESGKTPLESVKTLKRAYEIIEETGGVIIVVDTVPIDFKVSLIDDKNGNGVYTSGTDKVITKGRVSFLRYAKPTQWESLEEKEKYDVPTNLHALLNVKGVGELETSGTMVFDGHSLPVMGEAEFSSDGVEALAPIFDVEGTWSAGAGTTVYRNKNITQGAKGSGIYIHGGTLRGNTITVEEVQAPNGKGAAIYHAGEFTLDGLPSIRGEIYLTGSGSTGNESTSKYIKILLNGFKPKEVLNIAVEDAYEKRPIVLFPNSSPIPGAIQKNYFLLEPKVAEQYILDNRQGNERMLELQYRAIVYVDGVDGKDVNTGQTPARAVATLERAYQILSGRRGGYVYIVDTVTIKSDMNVSSTAYRSGVVNYDVIGGQVEIRRYVIPDHFSSDPEYTTKGTNLKTLFQVGTNGAFQLSDLTIDGHKNIKQVGDPYQDVSTSTKAGAPLISVESAGELFLGEKTILQNNRNVKGLKDSVDGGALANFGIVTFDKGIVRDNEAGKGAGIYQDGIFIIEDGADGIASQEVYLAAHQLNSDEWKDQVINIQYKMDLATTKLSINVDHPVKGRNIAEYLSEDAYNKDLDSEYKFYELGTTITSVKPTLDLVAADPTIEPHILELQNYEILDMEIPEEIFLVMYNIKPNARNGLLESPKYTITNGGKYKTNVSVIGFANDNAAAGITVAPWNLVDQKDEVEEETDLYLAVDKTKDTVNNGFDELTEKSLASVSKDNPIHFGTLEKDGSGSFTFTGQATKEFFEKYNDDLFPITNKDEQVANDHIKLNARAKYQLIYEFELVRD